MIIEDPDIVKKINERLSPQIRVWGVERTNGSFSAYQLCDSRIYEYLIPTYCFLPPHPESFLGTELPKLAEEAGDLPGYKERQNEVSSFWKETEEKHVKPFLDSLDPELSASIHQALYDIEPRMIDNQSDIAPKNALGADQCEINSMTTEVQPTSNPADLGRDNIQPAAEPDSGHISNQGLLEPLNKDPERPSSSNSLSGATIAEDESLKEGEHIDQGTDPSEDFLRAVEDPPAYSGRPPMSPLETAIKQLKNIIIAAKKAYRIDPRRLARVQSVLGLYLGTHNFHNYTISKLPRDPSAKRVIKSFNVAPKPITINDTEWLSLKVHGQSFMMHQIRKMVTMATLIVRCGCPEERMNESYGHERLTIPKAPSLGLLLERPVFDTYNNKKRVEDVEGKGEVAFDKYEKEIEDFKQREIYERIFREEDAHDT